MKSKLFLSLIATTFVITSCTNTNPNNYKLEDTWGANGDWGGKRSTTKEEKEVPVKMATKSETKKVAPKKTEAPKHVEKAETHKEEKVVKKEAPPVEKAAVLTNTAYKSVSYAYSIKPPTGWGKKDLPSFDSYYVKEAGNEELNFSVGVIKALSEKDLTNKFKEGYLKRISESLENVQVIVNKDENIKGKESWVLSYVFDQNGAKAKQMQMFIPHKNNILVLNLASSYNAFLNGKDDFKKISSSLTFN
jgi:hypothetical protein